ncbi:MAG TPA: hypothetical protein VN620_17245 [Candidatus Methylomirabilis sp.]|nr:hypothetical protein [Candidatus Methylomirabilis sp.]
MSSKSKQNFWMSKSAWLAVLVVAFAGTAVAAPPGNESDGHRCSNKTLNGSYGFLLEGAYLPSGPPFRGVVMQTYDGNGGITQVDHVVFAGSPPPVEWAPGTGTYSVNADCTGAAVLHTFTGDVSLHFVIVNNGKQINQVVDANAVTAVGNKVN